MGWEELRLPEAGAPLSDPLEPGRPEGRARAAFSSCLDPEVTAGSDGAACGALPGALLGALPASAAAALGRARNWTYHLLE